MIDYYYIMRMVSIRSVLRVTLTFTFDIVCAGAGGADGVPSGAGGVRSGAVRPLQPRRRRDSGRYIATLTLAKAGYNC